MKQPPGPRHVCRTRASTRRTAARRLVLAAGCIVAALAACKPEAREQPKQSAQGAPQTTKPAASGPPKLSYAPAEPWRSSKDPDNPVMPPDPATETWRVYVNQREPIQRPTPKWQPLLATQTISLAMPEGSRFQCVITPLRVSAQSNDFNTRLLAWVLRRELLCSSDGFATWTSYLHEVHAMPDGTRTRTIASAQLRELRELGDERKTYETYVLIRDDEERREAIPGPPRIIEGVVVDDD